MTGKSLLRGVCISAVFALSAVVTFYAVMAVVLLGSMGYLQSTSQYDVGNAGITFLPLAALAGLIAALFGGVLAASAIAKFWRRKDFS